MGERRRIQDFENGRISGFGFEHRPGLLTFFTGGFAGGVCS